MGQQTIIRAQVCVDCEPVLGSFHFFLITVGSGSWKQKINQNDYLFIYLFFEVPNIWPGYQIFKKKTIMHFFTLTCSYFYDSIIYN